MSVYKLICSATNKIYFGSTKNTIKFRREKGHKNCSCGDFVTPKLELVEKVDDLSKLYERELYYINNFDCVNINGKPKKEKTKEEIEKAKKRKNEQTKAIRKKIVDEKRFYCKLCDFAFQSRKKLIRHEEGFRHKLKNESFLKYGETWKEHYLIDNKERYKLTRPVNLPTPIIF